MMARASGTLVVSNILESDITDSAIVGARETLLAMSRTQIEAILTARESHGNKRGRFAMRLLFEDFR